MALGVDLVGGVDRCRDERLSWLAKKMVAVAH